MNLPGVPLNKRDIDSLSACWITAELTAQAMLRRVTSDEGKQLVGRKDRGNYAGIIFPYNWPGDKNVREYRLRRDKPDLEQTPGGGIKEKAKYLSPPGRGSMFYFTPGTPQEWLHNTSIPVVITEGEKKTIALYRLALYDTDPQKPRFLPLGIPGVWNWLGTIGKTAGPDGDRRDVKGTIADFDWVTWNRDVLIFFDANVNKPEIKTARARLALELKARRANVFYVNMPQIPGVNGVDDLLASQGPETVLSLIKSAQPQDIKVPEGFRMSETGVYAVDPSGEREDAWICSWLNIAASTRNHHGEDWGQLLVFRDKDGVEHKWLMPMSLLAGDGAEYRERLLSMGLSIAPGRRSRELLATYIQTAKPDRRVRCVSKVGWHGNAFILPDETFGDEEGKRVLLQTPYGSHHNIQTQGTLADWQSKIARYCAGNSILVFAVSCAFAGPVMPLASEGGGGFHLRGSSSTGKTTALMVAGSVWGGGNKDGYVQTWRTTANGLEAMAELHNHGLLCLDEMSQCDPREAAEIAYTLANGSGKLRMTRTIGARKKLEWEILFLSSGEISLADHVDSIGKRVRAGQDVRLCDIKADARRGMGIFENLHGFDSASDLARHLSTESRRVYGSAIRVYLARLVRNRSKDEIDIRKFRQFFIDKYVPKDSSGEVYRVASRIAVVAAAGELGRDITGWRKGECLEAAKKIFNGWIEGRGTTGGQDIEAAIRQVRGFIETHGSSRFQNLDEKEYRTIINRAGFKAKDDYGEIEYLILREVFRKEVCEGFDYRAVAEAMKQRGYLITEGTSLTMRKRVPEMGRPWVYCVKADFIEGV
jgi:putative DNA primase/helicase